MAGRQAQNALMVQSNSIMRGGREPAGFKLMGIKNDCTAKTSVEVSQKPQIKVHFAGLNPRRKLISAATS